MNYYGQGASAYSAGYGAAQRGQNIENNPHPKGSHDARRFVSGFLQYKIDERKKIHGDPKD